MKKLWEVDFLIGGQWYKMGSFDNIEEAANCLPDTGEIAAEGRRIREITFVSRIVKVQKGVKNAV